jgi:hypothetical protein
MTVSENFEAAPSGTPSQSPGPTEHATLAGKDVTVQKSPSPRLSQAVQQPLAQISGQDKKETHEHVFVALRSIFKKKATESPQEKVQLTKSYTKVESFLRQNIDSIVQRAKESETGGVSIPKTETGLPYTLRCLHDKKTGEVSFHISFGTFAEGGEAKVKEVYTIDRNGVRLQAQRSPKPISEGEVGQRSVSEGASRTGAALLEELSQKGVPGIAMQRPIRYTGKRGPKEASLSTKQPSTVFDLLIRLRDAPPSDAEYEAVWSQKMKICFGLIRAVGAMHQNGVIHCDLKPENVFLTKQGDPVVGDFGLAVRDKTQMAPRGSVGWIAPELLLNETVVADPSQDLWSLGALMLTLVLGGMPFAETQEAIVQAKTPEERAQKVEEFHQFLREMIVYVNTCGMDSRLAKIITGLLEPDPQKRMTDEELARAWSGGH